MTFELDRVTKRYGTTTALDGVSFGVAEGETLGLVGPNGAGKTTAIRILLGLVRPDAGTIRIDGARAPFPGAFRRLGYTGDCEHYADVSAERLFSLVADIRSDGCLAEARELAGRLSLDTRPPIRRLSRGNRQKVSIVLGLLSRPDLLVMDEPTTSLDPPGQRVFMDLLGEARARGASALISSHQLHDIEKACDRICLIDRGKVRDTVSISEIRRRSRSTIFVGLARGLPPGVEELPDATVKRAAPGAWEIEAADVPRVLALLMPAGILDIEVRKASLEQYFSRTVAPPGGGTRGGGGS